LRTDGLLLVLALSVHLVSCRSENFVITGSRAVAGNGKYFSYEGGVSANPQAVKAVQEGGTDTAVASWWGYDVEDSTKYLQSAIDSGVGTLIIPNMDTPWQVERIYLTGDQTILFEEGCVILAKKGAFLERGATLIEGENKENITLLGYGAVLEMRKEEYVQPPYPEGQWRHTLSIKSCDNVKIMGLTMRRSGGDGIYIGRSREPGSKYYCENIYIKDIVLEEHHRQGISIISAQDLLIENVTITGTQGTPPQAGIDFEPNNRNERLVNCIVRNCSIRSNRGFGVLFYLGTLDHTSRPIFISIEASEIRNNGISVWVGGVKNGASGSIMFRGNNLGLIRYVKRSRDLNVEFTKELDRQMVPVPPES
jgi:hypothetical protein